MPQINVLDFIKLGNAVKGILDKNAAKDTVQMQPTDVAKVAPSVTKVAEQTAADQLQPIIDHLTNNEAHWWQKRSFLSALVSLIGVVLLPIAANYGLEGYLSPENLNLAVGALEKLAAVSASYLAYRAGTAITPLFTKPKPLPVPLKAAA